MRKRGGKLIIAILTLFFFSIVGCEQKNLVKKETMELKYCMNADSLIQYFKENTNSVNPIYLSYHIQKLASQKHMGEAKKLDSFYRDYIAKEPNPKILFYYYIDKGYSCLSNLNKEECELIPQKLNDLNLALKDSTINIVYLTYKGSYNFFKNQIDSANSDFSKAYQLAVASNNRAYIERLANNLGSIALKSKQFRNARYYLSKAMFIMNENKDNNPVLISNLATTYMSEGNYLQAKKTLIEGIKNNKSSDLYTQQLLNFNLAMAYQNLSEYGECQKIMDQFQNKPINGALQSSFFVIQFKQALSKGHISLNEFIASHQPISKEKRYALLEYYKGGLKNAIESYPTILNKLGYTQEELNGSEFSSLLYERNEILSQLYLNQGDFKNAYYFKNRANIELDKLNSQQKLNIESEIDLAIHNADLDHSNQILKSENSFKSKQIILTNIILILAIFLLGFIIFTWRKNNQSHKKQLATTQEMLSLKIESERLQINENQLNEKLYSLSKLIVEKSIHFANELKQSDVSKNPKIIEIRRGLERLAEIDATFEKTKTELSNDVTYKPIFDKYPELNQLSVNGKKVLILSLQGYRPKEVAAMLDLSYDYVRNLKTKLNQIFAANQITGYQDLKDLL